jgi:dolichol-phosphate mannosyltransferase
MLSVKGSRYEYEMGVLMAAARKDIPFVTMPIRTIYEEGNASSHFSPIRDSVRINFLVLKDFLRFAGVSIMSFVLDQGLAWAFAAMMAAAHVPEGAMIWCSGFSARVLSAGFNFAMNRAFVFGNGGKASASAWKYAILCVSVIVLSNAGVMLLVALDMPRGLSKFLCDTLLYFAGYRIQARWVFSAD